MFIILEKTGTLLSLDLLWKGMLAIFVALGIIYCAIVVLNYLSSKKKKN